MYVIQTNTSIVNDKFGDFQSLMYKISKQSWDEFKDYILSSEPFTEKIINGTMQGNTKPSNWKVEEIIINDDIHLEVVVTHGKSNFKTNVKYYKVTDENFNNLL